MHRSHAVALTFTLNSKRGALKSLENIFLEVSLEIPPTVYIAIGVLSGSRAVSTDARPLDMLMHMVALHTADKSMKDSRVVR